MNKNEARLQAKNIRMKFDEHELHEMQIQISKQFDQLILTNVRFLQTYIPMINTGEVDPSTFVKYIQSISPEVMVSVPRIINELNMESILINQNTGFKKNIFGIDEPISGITVNPMDIDLVILPLLAFDLKGNRVGFGKGYYDRFLKLCKPNVLKVGLSFVEPIEYISDVTYLDIPMDYCITPKMTYAFK